MEHGDLGRQERLLPRPALRRGRQRHHDGVRLDACHSVVNPPGNEQWIFELVDGHDIYRVINNRRAPDGHKWCLSAPNGAFSRVYAEWCLNPALPVAAKQKWQPLAYSPGFNHLRSLNGSGHCLENRLRDDRLAFIHVCDGETYEEWSWS